ncbi:MAG TPA: dihydrolipoyl dehydrogenase [Acidimicrobiia bacterium]|jgi:dihydrolipoamide dehydrogenase
MVVGEVATGTDVLVIGGGPGGYAAALRAADLGKSVTLVERDRLGGVCLNVGCIPSKALIHAADLAASGAEAATMGVDLTAAVDMPAVQAWIAGIVARLTGGVDQLLRAAGVTVVTGTARFATAKRVAVWHNDDARFFEATSTIIATGSRTVALPELPFDGRRVLNSTGALALDRIPHRLVVVGAGYIGVELGTAFAKLGAEVTLVELTDRLLPGMPAGPARVVERALRTRGVGLHLGTKALGLDGDDLVVEGPQGEHRLPAEAVVVAVGRRPNTDTLGLEQAGVRLDPEGLVPVDPARRAARGIFAIGDVTTGPALAHKATAEAEVAALAAAGRPAAFDPATVPAIVFSDPAVATVGLTNEQAQEAGAETTSFTFPLAASGRAVSLGRTDGHVEVVAERGDGTVLGVHMVGPGVAELAFGAALAVEMGATVEDLALTIAPHPTLSEAIAEAAKGAAGRPLHIRR